MTFSKRVFDLALLALLLPFAVVLLPAIALAVWLTDGRPILFRGERMRAPGRPFTIWKFRTMRAVPEDGGASGGHKADRITKTGRILRRTRLDELPQLLNVLRGDLSFVGPRPPLRIYVERFPALYAEVLKCRPGITGLATLVYRRHEERLVGACRTADETEAVYTRRCVPRKAHLDLIYRQHANVCFDAVILYRTVRSLLARL